MSRRYRLLAAPLSLVSSGLGLVVSVVPSGVSAARVPGTVRGVRGFVLFVQGGSEVCDFSSDPGVGRSPEGDFTGILKSWVSFFAFMMFPRVAREINASGVGQAPLATGLPSSHAFFGTVRITP